MHEAQSKRLFTVGTRMWVNCTRTVDSYPHSRVAAAAARPAAQRTTPSGPDQDQRNLTRQPNIQRGMQRANKAHRGLERPVYSVYSQRIGPTASLSVPAGLWSVRSAHERTRSVDWLLLMAMRMVAGRLHAHRAAARARCMRIPRRVLGSRERATGQCARARRVHRHRLTLGSRSVCE